MAAATVRQKKSNRRHIPVEIVEEILLRLPIKSVLRFSSVSKSWRSMISHPQFIQRYGAVSGRERILISPLIRGDEIPYSSCSLSSLSSDLTIRNTTKTVIEFGERPDLVASCNNELWCVESDKSLCLWNPSMHTYKKLADSSPPFRREPAIYRYYGLGYDCVGNDYKILRLSMHLIDDVQYTELYSLRKDSWRNIEGFPEFRPLHLRCPGVFVSGALHWAEYGEMAPPTALRDDRADDSYIVVYAFRRKLCMYLSNYKIYNFMLWVMEDYGDDKPWTKLFNIEILDFPSADYHFDTLIPLYLYENGDILIEMLSLDTNRYMSIYKNRENIVEEIVDHGNHKMNSNSYVYVESLVSPAGFIPMPITLLES